MVAKLLRCSFSTLFSIILAKIHMVAKQRITGNETNKGIILAKIHMVAKQGDK